MCFCREFLKESLKELLKTDMKFCQRENVETHFWKILYHNIIEQLKKLLIEDKKELVNDYTMLLTNLIEEVCNLKMHNIKCLVVNMYLEKNNYCKLKILSGHEIYE